MESRSRPVTLLAVERLYQFLELFRRTFGPLWNFAAAMLAAAFPGLARRRRLRPWMIVRRARGRTGAAELVATEEEIRRLLERMKQLDDGAALTERAVGFSGQGADFFADPAVIERICEALVRENPPFLHLARIRPSEETGESRQSETEYLERESEIVVTEEIPLFVPQVGIHHRESKRPPGYPVPRVAKTLSDLRSASLLYQTLPEDLLIARLVEGSIPILAYHEERRYILFRQEQRLFTRRERRRLHVPVPIETGSEGNSTRLMYMLFDRSTSLVRNCSPRGLNATMELAIAAAMVRSDLGRPRARYYFRAFAERLDPLAKDPPVVAQTVTEKDRLVQRLYRTNFSGEATNVVEALDTAIDDIERIVLSGELGDNVRPRICLLTDGQATLYRNVGVRLKRLGIELDSILIGKEAAHNPELLHISSTVTLVDPEEYVRKARLATSATEPAPVGAH